MRLLVGRRHINPERNLVFIAGHVGINLGSMIAADEVNIVVVHLLAVVGNIEHDGLLLFEATDNLVDDGVVVEQRIIVPCQALPFGGIQLRAVVVVGLEFHLRLRTAGAVIHMLPLQMEDNQIMRGVLGLQAVVVVQKTFVEIAELIVAGIEHSLRELGIIKEETAREIVDGLFSLRQELVGEESHMIAGLAEHLGEQRIVAPLAAVAHTIEREQVLEDETGQVPRSHHIGERIKLAVHGARQLSGRGGLFIAI